MSIGAKLKKNLTWFLIFLFVFSNVAGLIVPSKKAKAASYTFSPPGKWTTDGSSKLYNEIETTGPSGKQTITWEYTAEAGGTGTLWLSKLFVDEHYDDVTMYKLSGPKELMSVTNWANYYVFVGKWTTDGPSGVMALGYLTGWNRDSERDFYFRSSAYADRTDKYMNFTYAKGGADTPLGQYLVQLTPYLGKNKIIPIEQRTPAGTIEDSAKKACKDLLIKPFSQSGDPIYNQFFKKINEVLGSDVIQPIDASTDLSMYKALFKSDGTDNKLDYSDRYIDSNMTVAYQAALNYFHQSESGLGWFWRDKQASAEKNGLLSILSSIAIYKVGGTAAGVFGLLPTAAGLAATLSVDYYKANVNAGAWNEMAKLIQAEFYLRAHMEYDRCIAANTSNQAFKDMLAKEEIQYKTLIGLIDTQLSDYITAQQQADTGILEGSCGVSVKMGTTAYFIGTALCAILKMFGDITKWLTSTLFQSIYNAYRSPPEILEHLSFLTAGFSISKAHAAEGVSDLIKVLDTKQAPADYKWVVDSWKWILVLTNLFLVVILLFLGIVNILHIQYDTYAIKKMLPLLIIGVILANFSLLIMRMLVDAANILTTSFLGQDPSAASSLITKLINTVKITDQQHAMLGDWGTVGVLLLAVLFGAFAMIAFVILGVMFYIRFASIILLAIVAPLAFVMLAFPPTQGIFKQWWSWATKMTFMKPISFFLLYLASMIKSSGADVTITGWLIMTVIVYIAILVPWKLGGAVMAMWGGAMGTLFGTKKGGWSRTPVENWWDRRKNRFGSFMIRRFPGIAGRSEADKEGTELARKKAVARAKEYTEGKMGGKMARERRLTQEAEDDLTKLQSIHMWGVEAGKLKQTKGFLSKWWFKKTTGAKNEGELAKRLAESTANSQVAVEIVNKNRAWNLFTTLGARQRGNKDLRKRFKDMLKANIGLKAFTLNDDGSVTFDDAGKNTQDYANYDDFEMQLLRKEKSEKDPAKRAKLHQSFLEVQRRRLAFRDQNQEWQGERLNYDDLLDKNANGRILKILTPLLIDEMHTNAQNENLQTFLKALNNGGGYGEVIANPEEEKLVIRRKYSRLKSSDPINATMAIVGGYKEKMAANPDTSDALEYFGELIKFLQQDDVLGKTEYGSFWPVLLESMKRSKPGVLANLAKEFTDDQLRKGVKPENLMIPMMKDYIGDDGRIDPKKFLQNFENLDKALITGIPIEVVPQLRLSSGDTSTKFQREFFRAGRTKVENMPELGGGSNPALIGSEVEDQPLFTTLKSNGGEGGGGGGGAPMPDQPSPEEQAAQAKEQKASVLWTSRNVEEVIRTAGGGSAGAYDKLEESADVIDSMRTKLGTQLWTSLDVDTSGLNDIISRLAGMDINLPIDDIESQLRQINPNVTLDRDITVNDYITQAKKVSQGVQNFTGLAEKAWVDTHMTYAQAAPKDQQSLENAISGLANCSQILLTAAQEFSASKGEKGISRDDIEQFLSGVSHAVKTELPSISLDGLRDQLQNNDFTSASTLVERLKEALTAKKETLSDQSALSDDQKLERALTRSFRRTLQQQGAGTQITTPTQPTPPPAPPEQAGPTPDQPEADEE